MEHPKDPIEEILKPLRALEKAYPSTMGQVEDLLNELAALRADLRAGDVPAPSVVVSRVGTAESALAANED